MQSVSRKRNYWDIQKRKISSQHLRKKPFIYQYQDKYISAFDPSEEIEEVYYESYYDNSMYEYENVSELNDILAGFTTITDNLIQIHLDKEID